MVAVGALLAWPLVVAILFQRYRIPVALICSIVAGYLLLPPKIGINLPLMPTLDKNLIPGVAALVIVILTQRRQASLNHRMSKTVGPETTILPGWIPQNNVIRILLLMVVVGAFLTTMTNTDPLFYGPRTLPGLSLYDAFSAVQTTAAVLIPFFLARKFLADPENHRTLLIILCIAGLCYSLPALYEVRMSPQLSKTLYGFFPGSWRQTLRGDGFRPVVFLAHGLRVGIFFTITALSAFVYFRLSQTNERWRYLAIAFWIFVTLVLSKSLGALLILMALAPVAFAFGSRQQLQVAAVLAFIVISFPILRGTGLVPVERLTAFAEQIDPARAQSLAFRFSNEDGLLDKANQRPAFGWGGWARSRVFNEDGLNVSITDGYWAIIIGRGGWARYIGEFGLLTMPIILLALRRRRYEITLATSGLCLVLAANLVDLLPNSALTPITWLMAGALAGRLELQRISDNQQADTPAPVVVQTSRYSRPRPVRPTTPPPDQPDTAPPDKRLPYSRQPAKTHKPPKTKI